MEKDLRDLRKDYRKGELTPNDRDRSPFVIFSEWFDEATEAGVPEPNAMNLATVHPDKGVDSRVVLLKEVDNRGFVFYTNYQSTKGAQMRLDPRVSLNFNWLEAEKQIRIRGAVETIDSTESDEYFYSRPKDSQIGAIVSHQSQPLSRLDDLEAEFNKAKEELDELKRPEHWGGYRVIPSEIEFWQGRPGRMHHRLLFTRVGDNWESQWLYP